MDNLNDRIKYFQALKREETNSSVTKISSLRTTSKLKIPSIFISSETSQETATRKDESKVINKLLSSNLDKNISQSVGGHLNLLDAEPKPLIKSRSQEVILFKPNDDCNMEPEEPEKRISGGLHKAKGLEDLSATELDKEPKGLHKSKGFEDLPLATLEDESIVPDHQLTPMEEELQVKPRILETVPKKIEITLTDDTNIEFRKRLNLTKSNRTQSLIEEPKKTVQQINAEKLFVDKLNEIKSKRRSAEFNSPTTFVFNFTKKNSNKSQSVNNLNTINDEKLSKTKSFHKSSDNILLEVVEQESKMPIEDIVQKRTKGLKTIPKEIRIRSMAQAENHDIKETNSSKVTNDTNSLQFSIDQFTNNDQENDKTSQENDEVMSHISKTEQINSTVVEDEMKILESLPILEITPPLNENDTSFKDNEEIIFNFNQNDQLLTGPMKEEEKEKPPTPAPRKVSSPAFVQNEEYMSGSDLKQVSGGIESSKAFSNEEYMSSDKLEQQIMNVNNDLNEEVKLSVPVPAPRRRPLSSNESV